MKLKALVIAAAFAVTGTAFAKIGSVVETADGGEMNLNLFSLSGEATYQLDSGILFKDFNLNAFAKLPDSTTPYTWSTTLDTATDVAFASFVAVAGSATDLSFSFFGGDNNGVSAAQRGMTTTVRAGGNVAVITNGNIVDGNNQLQTYMAAVNGKHPAGVATNGSSFFTKAEGAGHYYTNDRTTLLNKFPIGNDGLVGTSLDVYSFVRSSTSLGGDAIETKLGTFNVAQLNATQYSVSFSTPVTEVITPSVPEPTSLALSLVGLAAFGVVAARRRAQ